MPIVLAGSPGTEGILYYERWGGVRLFCALCTRMLLLLDSEEPRYCMI